MHAPRLWSAVDGRDTALADGNDFAIKGGGDAQPAAALAMARGPGPARIRRSSPLRSRLSASWPPPDPMRLPSVPPSAATRPVSRLAPVAIACGLALQAAAAQAQSQFDADAATTSGSASMRTLDARIRLGVERLKLPGREHIGLVGMTELLNVSGEWWAGPAVYGAGTGHRGGFFVPGVEGAWSHPVNNWLALDAGVFAGGGGGGAAPVGGGLMLRPHIDVVFRLNGFYTGPTYSKIWFPSGQINASQFGWMLNVNSSFRYRPAEFKGSGTDGSATGLGFDHIDATVTFARPHKSITTAGLPLTQRIGFVGLRAERTVDGPFWAGVETAGAASGGVAGYAEVLGTTGLRWSVVEDRLSLGVRAAAGVGGGGGIDTGGGLLVKAAAGATLRVTDTLGIGAEVGLVHAPQGRYDARTTAVSLNWALDVPQSDLGSWFKSSPGTPTLMEFGAGAERYRAARKDGRTEALQAVVLQVNRFVAPNLYVTGQAHSAYAGGAGAYSVGLFGVGAQLPVTTRMRLGIEALAGAAGGGGVDTGAGAVMQGRAYVDVSLTDALSFRVAGGKIKSVHGGLDAPVVDAALVFRFGVDRTNKR